MLGRRWKQAGNLRCNPDCPRFIGEPKLLHSFSSDSSIMPPRTEMSVYTYSETLVLGPGESLGREDGSWEDVNYYFVQCRRDPKPLEYYYRDLSKAYRGPNGTLGREPYNEARLDRLFASSPVTHYPHHTCTGPGPFFFYPYPN